MGRQGREDGALGGAGGRSLHQALGQPIRWVPSPTLNPNLHPPAATNTD